MAIFRPIAYAVSTRRRQTLQAPGAQRTRISSEFDLEWGNRSLIPGSVRPGGPEVTQRLNQAGQGGTGQGDTGGGGGGETILGGRRKKRGSDPTRLKRTLLGG